MDTLSFLFSPRGRVGARPFLYGALAIYLLGAASQALTVPELLGHGGLRLFIAAQLVLVWIWFCLHAKRLHDAGRSGGLALGIALFYLLSIVLLLIIADGLFATFNLPLGDANAGGALWLIVVFYIVSALTGSGQYDLGFVVVAILGFMAVAPIVLALGLTLWTAGLRRAEDK